MKRFKLPTILESESEPLNTNCIWKKGDDFKEFKNGEWVNSEMFASDEFKSVFGDLVYAMYKFSEPVRFMFINVSGSFFSSIKDSNVFGLFDTSCESNNTTNNVPVYVHDSENNKWILLSTLTSTIGNIFNSGTVSSYNFYIDAIAFAENKKTPDISLAFVAAFDSIVGKSFDGTTNVIKDSNNKGLVYRFAPSVKITKCI